MSGSLPSSNALIRREPMRASASRAQSSATVGSVWARFRPIISGLPAEAANAASESAKAALMSKSIPTGRCRLPSGFHQASSCTPPPTRSSGTPLPADSLRKRAASTGFGPVLVFPISCTTRG